MKISFRKIIPILLLVTAVGLRLPLINGSFWLDEAAQALEVTRPLAQQLQIAEDFQPPLLHLILHVAQYFGHSEWWLRTIGALIPGLGTIYFLYQIARRHFKIETAQLIAALLITSSFHIFYSQELRPYSLPAFLAVYSWFVLLSKNGLKTRLNLIKYMIATYLGILSSYLYPFLLLSQLTFVYQHQKSNFKKLIMSVSLVGLGTLPLFPILLGQLDQSAIVRNLLPTWEKVVSVPQLKSLPLLFAKFVFGVVNVELNLTFILLCVAILTMLVLGLKSSTVKEGSILPALYHWVLVPIISSWLFSFIIPILQPKRVLFVLPAFYLLIGFLFQNSKNKYSKLLVAGLLVINLFGTISYFTDPQLQRENWRQLHQQIITQFPRENTVVVFAAPEAFAPWRWYDDGTFPVVATGYLAQPNEKQLQESLNLIVKQEPTYVLVFDYLRDITDPNDLTIKAVKALGYDERYSLDYPNIGLVRVSTRQEAVTAYDTWR